MLGKLYVPATPIGNLQDISLRALEIFREVDFIACEDTRHTGKLLKHFQIKKNLISYHEHNEDVRSQELLELLQNGKSIALVSDAGMPGIADPGFVIVSKAQEIGVKAILIPGAVAFVSAVVISGMPTDSIFFGGFLPSKKGERRKRLRKVLDIPATLCFYETPHRIGGSLNDCYSVLGNRKAAVVRELTKLHEEVISGNLKDFSKRFETEKLKGEIVVVIDRNSQSNKHIENTLSISERISELNKDNVDRKKALKIIAKELGISKSKAYRLLQEEKNN